MKAKTNIRHFRCVFSLAALFLLSCQEQTIVTDGITTGMRPTASYVTLITDEVTPETRLGYNSNGYYFEAGDTLGACLMDLPNVGALSNPMASWYDKYNLVSTISTNYPFVRNIEGVWISSAKLSEGNYFFMFPYNSHEGSRSAYTYTLGGQTMKDTSTESLQRAFATSNFFVGYAQIKEGTTNSDAVRIRMRPAFGALGFTVVNNGNQAYTLRRVVVKNPGKGFPTTVTVDPTNCVYATTTEGHFNVAQYIGDSTPAGMSAGYVPDCEGYTPQAALDDLIKPLPEKDPVDEVAVSIEHAEPLAAGQSQNILVMLPQGSYDDLLVDIETDRGTVHNLPLVGKTHIAVNQGVIRELTFKDEDVPILPATDASGTDEVAYLIRWNVNTATGLAAQLNSNIHISREMYDQLRDGKSTKLHIEMNGHSVIIDRDVDTSALCGKLEFSNMEDEGRIVVIGEQELTTTVDAIIDNEGTLRLASGSGYRIKNHGNVYITGKASVMQIVNHGMLDVKTGTSLVGSDISNQPSGVCINRGTLEGMTDNIGLLTNLGTLTGECNAGTIYNDAGTITLTQNIGNIYAEGVSTTVIGANAEGHAAGNLIITNLADGGNFKVEDGALPGYIVQELETDTTTAYINHLANTLWLDATLIGVKDNTGNRQDIDLSTYSIVAVGSNARLDNGGKEIKVGNLQVKKGATLTIFKADVNCASVRMEGETGAIATLQISNWGNLYYANAAATIYGNIAYNKVENYGGEKTKLTW